MARKQTTEKRGENFRTVRRTLLVWTSVSVAIVAALYSWQHVERFLLRDSRFTLAAPPDLGDESPNIRIEGVKYTSRSSVGEVFQQDYGHSIYRLPVARRRLDILGINWVEEARVSRVWPNEIRVSVKERQPVAFVRLPGEMALIDQSGAILQPMHAGQFQLPVLAGVTREQPDEERRLRVRRMQKLLEEAGPLAKEISEISAEDPDNLRVVQPAGDHAVTLILGNRHFKQRLENFRVNYPQIQKRAPRSRIFDLRMEDRIIAVPEKAGDPSSGGGRGE
jgi:cell division protein FtsQ